MDNKIETIIYVKGPDIAVDHEPFIATCQEMGIKTFVVGDGIRNIQLTEITDIIKEQKGEVFLFFHCHGIRPLTEAAQEQHDKTEAELEALDTFVEAEIAKIQAHLTPILKDTLTFDKAEKQLTVQAYPLIKQIDSLCKRLRETHTTYGHFNLFKRNEADFKDELHLLFDIITPEDQKHPLTLRNVFTAVNQYSSEINVHYWFSTCFAGYGHKIAKDYLKPKDTFIAFGRPTTAIYGYDTEKFLLSFPEDSKTFYANGFNLNSIVTDFCLSDIYCSNEADYQALIKFTFNGKTFDMNQLPFPRNYSEANLNTIAQELGKYCKKDALEGVVTKLQNISSLQELSREEQRIAIAAEYSLFKK